MTSFKEFISESESEETEEENEIHYPDGVYIAVKLSEVTENAIKEYQEKYLKTTKANEELHCTIIYSQKPHVDEIEPKEYQVSGTFNEFNLFGPKNDTLVFEIHCDDLVRRNSELVDEHRFTSDYDEYHPHITLSYEAQDVDINSLPPIEFAIQLESEYVDPLDTNWAGDGDGNDKEESGTFVGQELAKSDTKDDTEDKEKET